MTSQARRTATPHRAIELTLVALVLACAAVHSSADFVTAAIGDAADSMPHLIYVPDDTPDGRYVVRCEGEIGARGKALLFGCHRVLDTTPQSLVIAIRQSGEQARFVAASEDGEPVAVYMALTVWVKVTERKALIGVYPNDGLNVAQFGLDYVSPQRLNQFTLRLGAAAAQSPSSMLMRLSIDENGKVTGSRIETLPGSPKTLEQAVRRSIKLMDFRPGYYQGRPTAMDYVEGVCNQCVAYVR
jgi:hypothetical protein